MIFKVVLVVIIINIIAIIAIIITIEALRGSFRHICKVSMSAFSPYTG